MDYSMPNKNHDKTVMGGAGDRFLTTVWTEISQAKTLNEEHRKNVIDDLIKNYWKPVYCYLRRKGKENEPAKDITQGFFCEVVLGRNLIQRADKNKGRFRTFLLTALDRYVTDIYHKEHAKKRSPQKSLVSLDANELSKLIIAHSDLEPDQAFNYIWAYELLTDALKAIENHYIDAGKKVYWHAFNDRIVKPIMDGTESPSISDICTRYGIDNEARASDMIYRVKLEFRQALRDCLRKYVESESEIEEEFNSIFEILSRNITR